jgi:hypothetical protein
VARRSLARGQSQAAGLCQQQSCVIGRGVLM